LNLLKILYILSVCGIRKDFDTETLVRISKETS